MAKIGYSKNESTLDQNDTQNHVALITTVGNSKWNQLVWYLTFPRKHEWMKERRKERKKEKRKERKKQKPWNKRTVRGSYKNKSTSVFVDCSRKKSIVHSRVTLTGSSTASRLPTTCASSPFQSTLYCADSGNLASELERWKMKILCFSVSSKKTKHNFLRLG